MITDADAIGPYSPQLPSAFRVGIVSAQQLAPFQAVRVKFPDRDQIESWWLPIVQPKAQDDKVFWLPDIGEQVVVLMDEHDENGAVLGAIPSQVDTPPGWGTANTFGVQFSDGTIVRYDRAAHALTVLGGAGTTISVTDGAGTVLALTNDGNVKITGNLHVTGAVIGGYGGGDQVGLQSHLHSGVVVGGSDTAAPVAGT